MQGRLRPVGRKAKVTLLVLFLLATGVALLLTENASAQGDVQFIWGMIFTSDGLLLPYDTDFRVWVLHNGTWKGFPSNDSWDPVGTLGGWYSYTLPWEEKEINWSNGDLYRIQIDCTPSGGLAENATSNGTSLSGDPVSPRGSYNNAINWMPGGGENNSQGWDVVCSAVDLIPTDMEVNGIPYSPPMAVSPFSTVSISARVTNVGQTPISEPNTIVLRNESGIIGQDTAITIDAGASVGPFNFTWDAPSGGYFCFNATVDYYDNVTEMNEDNNSAMICLSVGAADLTPSGIGIATDYGTQFYADASSTNYRSEFLQITPGTSADIVANVTNVGTLTSGACRVAYHNTTYEGGPIPPAELPFLDASVASLNPGSYGGPYTASWFAPSPGEYYVNITADYYDDVTEIDELNNTFVLRFLVGYPDYVPWNLTPSSPLDVTSGSLVSISSEVRNVGELDALRASTIAFYNETVPGAPFFTASIPPLVSGQSSSPYIADWIAPTVSVDTSYNVTIEVDYYAEIQEENEVNNTVTIQFWVHPGPVTSLNPRDPHYWRGQDLYIKSTTLLNFTIQSTADWVHAEYWIDDGSILNYSLTGEFTITGEGLHILNFSSFDSLGYREKNNTQRIIVDDSPPITTLNITSPKHSSGVDIWVKGSTPIYLNWTREDEPILGVGRDFTSYRIFDYELDIWTSWTNYSEGVPFEFGQGDGERIVEWYSVDLLTNRENTQNRSLYVDDSGPDSLPYVGEPSYERDYVRYIESTTKLSLSADDHGGSGVKDIEYRLDTETQWHTYTGPFTLSKPGEHVIYIRSTDNLGNIGDIVLKKVFVIGPNYKPMIAVLFIMIMIIAGAVVGYKRPLLIARKRMIEVEDQLLKEEEVSEKAKKEAFSVPGEGAVLEAEASTEAEVEAPEEEVT